MSNRPVDACFFTDEDRLTHREALELIGARVQPSQRSRRTLAFIVMQL